MSSRLVLISCEPVLHDLLVDRLQGDFQIVVAARSLDDALAVARSASADVILFDADLAKGEPADLIAKLTLVSAAPIVALSAHAPPGSVESAGILAAGARAIVAKPAGPLPLDLTGNLGETLVSSLQRVASS